MNRNIRLAVFETNSSSTHSISLSSASGFTPTNSWKSMLSDDESRLIVRPGEFGWEEETFTDAATKASYLLTSIVQCLSDDEQPDMADPQLAMLLDVVKSETGLPAEIEPLSGYHRWGYIDHQSDGVPGVVWEGGHDAVRRFIFDAKSVLETDNDNH